MNFTDLSDAQDIGTTCLFVEIGPFRIVVDAGINPQKVGWAAVPDFSRVDSHSIDFIILTHCHLDHLGALPVLFKKQHQARILTSIPSMMLAPRMLGNSCNVMLRQREELEVKEYPLYTRQDIHELEPAFLPMSFHSPRTFEKEGQQLDITFYPAGHIVGAAGCLLTHKHRKVFFTGDVLFEPQKTIPGASFPQGPLDVLVMETTRGHTRRPATQTRRSEIHRLLDTINHTLDRGGSCLIPTFALGRMQEILAILNEARNEHKLPKCPIYCSGLGLDLVDYFDTIARRTGLVHFRRKILNQLKVKPLKKNPVPGQNPGENGIYILSSGMLVENTPSYAAAASLIDNHHNSICYVGYCDPATPGGKMLATPHGESFLFEALDYIAHIRASVDQFDLSGHADREELLQFAIDSDPRAIVLTHGDPASREWFEASLIDEIPRTKILNPTPLKPYLV